MRSPSRKRPRLRQVSAPPEGASLAELAKKVSYVGSPEHKAGKSFAGMPHPRSDASLCPKSLASAAELTRWLRKALRDGQVGAPWENGYPRYAWYRKNDQRFEARLVNRGNGEYKGYPIAAAEWPQDLA